MRSPIHSFLILPVLVAATACFGEETEPPVTCGEPTHYRIGRVDVPDVDGEAANLAVDLDGDGVVDNALGGLVTAMRDANPDIGSIDASATARLGRDATWQLAIRTCSDNTLRVGAGQSDGADAAPLSLFVDPFGNSAAVQWAPAERVTSALYLGNPGEVDGTIGFAVRMPDATHALLGPYADYFTWELGARTSAVAQAFDLDHDGTVTVDELLASAEIQRLVRPDIALDASGVKNGFSVGVSFAATQVAP